MNSIYRRLAAALAIAALCACSSDPQSEVQDRNQTANEGDVPNSSLTFYSMTPSDSEPVASPIEITDIICDTDSDTRQVRIDLGEEGHVLVRDDHRLSDPAWLIVVDLTRLDIAGGKRETIHPERTEAPFHMDQAGNIQGVYGFRLYADLEGRYGVEMDIRCS